MSCGREFIDSCTWRSTSSCLFHHCLIWCPLHILLEKTVDNLSLFTFSLTLKTYCHIYLASFLFQDRLLYLIIFHTEAMSYLWSFLLPLVTFPVVTSLFSYRGTKIVQKYLRICAHFCPGRLEVLNSYHPLKGIRFLSPHMPNLSRCCELQGVFSSQSAVLTKSLSVRKQKNSSKMLPKIPQVL